MSIKEVIESDFGYNSMAEVHVAALINLLRS